MLRGKKQTLLLFLFPLFIFSQKIDSVYVDSINSIVAMLRYDGKFNEAYKLSNKLLSTLQNNQSKPILFAETYYTKSRIEMELGEYDQAFISSRKSFQIYLKKRDSIGIAKVYNLFGVGYYYKNQIDSTLLYYQKSFDLKKRLNFDNQELAVSAYNLAMVYEDTGLLDEAMELYLSAEKYLLKNKDFYSFLSDVYIGIAHIYKYKQDFNQAEKFADRAMDIGLKSYGEFNPNMTFVYTSYANILISEKKYKEAIELLTKGLKIREKTYGFNHKWSCESYIHVADAYVLDEQFDQAEKYFRKAIDIGKSTQSILYLAEAKTSLAKMYCDENIKNEEVEMLLKESLKTFKNIYGNKSDIIADVFYYLAKNAKNRNDKKVFFSYLVQTYDAGNYNEKYLNKIIAPFQVLDALGLQSDWYEQEFNNNQNIDLLKVKFTLIDKQSNLIKYLQNNYSSEISKISLANNYREVFEKGLNTCWVLYHKTKDQKYLEKAFELSEINRNTTLLEGLQEIKYKLFSEIPKDLLEFEKALQQDLAQVKMDLYYSKNSSNPDKEELSNLLDKRILISIELDSLHNVYTEKFPKYKNLKFSNKTIHISDVQNSLDAHTQFIIYFLGENNLYTFNITKEEVTLLKSKIANEIVEKTISLKSKLLTQKDIENTSKRLYLYLLSQQIDLTKNKIIIVPDNVLNYIPFEILQNDKNKYLIEDFTVSYSGSVHLFLELKNDFFNYSLPNYWVGFSPKYQQDNKISSSLDEVSTISEIVNGKKFIGVNSKKQNFLNNNKDYSIIHLAMHAEINNNNPLYNKLFFTDNELTYSEISILNNKANLAVLSACNTGFGKLEKGEGVMSMARAFHFSGVPSVLMSLWKVPDKETKDIMVFFYKHLKKGETKNLALKNAKLDYLASTKDKNLKHPYFWSGFVLNGNTDILVPTTNNYYYYFMSGILVLGLIIFGIKFIKRDV